MTLAIGDLITPATTEEWNAQLLANAATLKLKTTSWQRGEPSRTILEIMAATASQQDAMISLITQGGFLDFAATGSVSYVGLDGKTTVTKVTPDPSVPGENPDGTPGWLDVLASSVYNVAREGAAFASNYLYLANTSSNTYGPYAVGTYHVTNPSSGAGYSNTEALTIGPANFVGTAVNAASNTSPIVIGTSSAHGLSGSEVIRIAGVLGNTAANGFWNIVVLSTTSFSLVGSTGNGAYTSGGTANVCTAAIFAADVAGPNSTAAPGTITQTVTTLSGVTCNNLQSFVGTDWESNTALAARCRLKIQSLSPNGPGGAYEYFALSANSLLAAESPPVELSAPVTRVITQSSATTGIITTVIASASGAVPGISNLAVSGATNASPIVLTTATHGLSTGDYVTVSGVLGNTAANGTWTITVLSGTTFSLTGSAGNAAYTSGGIVQGGDLGQVDKIIQANAVPDDITAITESAIAFNVNIVAAVEVPQANVAIYSASVQSALALYFASLPIGGINGELQYNDIVGVLFAAGGSPSVVRRITSLTLNGSTSNVPYTGALYVAQLSPSPTVTVTGY